MKVREAPIHVRPLDGRTWDANTTSLTFAL